MATVLERRRDDPSLVDPTDGVAGSRGLRTVVVVGAAVAVVRWWGAAIVSRDSSIHVSAAPFVGAWQSVPVSGGHLAAALTAVVLVAAGPWVARRLRWALLVPAAAAAAVLWSVVLAASDGWHRLAEPLATRYEYLGAVDRVGSATGFLRTFVDRLPSYPTHVKGHPPGMVLVLWVLDATGLGGAGWAAALVLGVAGVGVAAVLLVVADLAGRDVARVAAPFLVLSPAAVFIGTSSDALFSGVAAIAVAVGVAAVIRDGRLAWLLAIGAGVLFAAVALLSYGLVLLGLVPVAVGVVRRRLQAVVLTAATAATLLGVLALVSGFWWLDGLAATRTLQLAGVAPRRSGVYFAFANLAVTAVCVGPAAVAAVASLARVPRRLLALAGGAAAAVLVADLSGFSKGEVERIWLPFFPWLAVIAVALPAQHRSRWLAANAATALALQLLLRSPW